MDELLASDPKALSYVIQRSCEIKRISLDGTSGSRGTVRFSISANTFGHAVESATHYTRWLHGEAIGAGLLMAAAMSHEVWMVEASQVDRLRRFAGAGGLPVRIEGVTPEVALEHMRIDKKALGGRMRLILLRSIGESFVTADYPRTGFASAVEYLLRMMRETMRGPMHCRGNRLSRMTRRWTSRDQSHPAAQRLLIDPHVLHQPPASPRHSPPAVHPLQQPTQAVPLGRPRPSHHSWDMERHHSPAPMPRRAARVSASLIRRRGQTVWPRLRSARSLLPLVPSNDIRLNLARTLNHVRERLGSDAGARPYGPRANQRRVHRPAGHT